MANKCYQCGTTVTEYVATDKACENGETVHDFEDDAEFDAPYGFDD